MSKGGLVVIKRYRSDSRDPVSTGAMRRVPALGLSPSEVLLRYRGLDGQPWPREFDEPSVVCGFAPLERLNAVLERLQDSRVAGPYDLLYCVSASDANGCAMAPAGFEQLGFDVGFFRGEDETYSVLLHEVLLGLEPRMRELATLLNENLLLPDGAAVDRTLVVRRDLAARGADLENPDGEAPRAFLVFGQVGQT